MIRRHRVTAFRKYCEKRLAKDWSEYRELPILCRDVSDRSLGNFEDFCDRIAEAAVVFSTRLHVGIFAAMLGKPTYVFEGPYHKIKAIYEHSMANMDHVTFVSRDELTN